jgi:hypothetical protein
MLDHFLVRIRGSEPRIRFHYGTTSGFGSRAFSQNGQNRKFFGLCGLEKTAGRSVLPGKCQGQNGKRLFSSECARLLGLIAASLVLPRQPLPTSMQRSGQVPYQGSGPPKQQTQFLKVTPPSSCTPGSSNWCTSSGLISENKYSRADSSVANPSKRIVMLHVRAAC